MMKIIRYLNPLSHRLQCSIKSMKMKQDVTVNQAIKGIKMNRLKDGKSHHYLSNGKHPHTHPYVADENQHGKVPDIEDDNWSSSSENNSFIQADSSYSKLLQNLSQQQQRHQQRLGRERSYKRRKLAGEQEALVRRRIEPPFKKLEVGDSEGVGGTSDEHIVDDVEVSEREDEDPSSTDPFSTHLSEKWLENLNQDLSKSNLRWEKKVFKHMSAWNSLVLLPNFRSSEFNNLSSVGDKVPQMHLKKRLSTSLSEIVVLPTGIHSVLASHIFSYRDVSFCDRNITNADFIRYFYSLHVTNHILKTRDGVIRNNSKISKAETYEDDIEYRDQGFTRPKVLIVLPTKQACVRVVDQLVKLLSPEQQENKKRFQDTYSRPEDLSGSDKPADFKELFSGNDDDNFIIGVKVTRKTVKFFSSFYTSDLIISSPLSLYDKITSPNPKKSDVDFLSSIEILIIDQTDALLMQNWEHVDTIIEHLNLEPKEAHGCDFARVRRFYLDNRARFFRQTLTFGAYNAPELNSLFERGLMNISGKVKISQADYKGYLSRLGVQTKQSFSRFDCSSPTDEPEARFKMFASSILPALSHLAKTEPKRLTGTLIFVPSYMDFLRIQNLFTYSNDSQSITFDPGDMPCISEYAPKSQNARAKSLFQSGRHPILLYTGRAHHFYRYKLIGVRRVVLYGLPENPLFYQEIVGDYLARSISEGRFSPEEVSTQALFSKFDALRLERIVGTQRLLSMLRERRDIFEFV